jgi:hypothetical protein
MYEVSHWSHRFPGKGCRGRTMSCLGVEELTAMTVLLKQGRSQSSVGRIWGVSEGTVRYHRKRWASGASDGRSNQSLKASKHAEAIEPWRSQQGDGRVNLAALHDWLCRKHGYDGSLKPRVAVLEPGLSGPGDPEAVVCRDPCRGVGTGGKGGVGVSGAGLRDGGPCGKFWLLPALIPPFFMESVRSSVYR